MILGISLTQPGQEGTKVNEGNFVFQIGIGNGFALQVGQGELRGGFVAGDKDEGKKRANCGNDKE